ncbi:MAG: Fe-S protein assembly chaperone HscA [Gammaproteobacteria bacterium]|nr:Fe-S protein assembly chaperone HscA [Gammaproteobacteria bacterium]MDH5800918.1 Fe-S protein assembly chaperone HscA [Gammaproteobacteria bacterium]
MALIQISEPGQSTAPHQHRLAVGIDLGTTNSLVATVRSGLAETIADAQGMHLLPSVVRYKDNGSCDVGSEARAAMIEDPQNTILSVKRIMGRGYDDVMADAAKIAEYVKTESAVPKIRTAAGDKSAVEVSADILAHLRGRAEQALGGELTGCVITVPAYFDDAQRQATKDAATLAGLHVFRLLNEPTAAAVAYGLDQQAEGVHVIYDLGGGTFDVSILRLHRGVFEVMSTAGDTALGGDDMDKLIMDWMVSRAAVQIDVSTQESATFKRALRHEACRVKEQLSQAEQVPIQLNLPGGIQWSERLTREEFNRLIDPVVKRTLLSCRRALRDAGIEVHEVQDVVMVGGSTRVPYVRSQVGEFFECEPLVDLDPDKVVALGAAIQADILAGNKPDDQLLLLDVIPLSLGIETMGGLTEKVIQRNTTIPVSKAQDFTTFKDGQTAMSIHVVQGERELVSDCRSLAKFELRGIPPMVAGAARIRVTFQVDADGLLSVSAREQTQGIESNVQVKPSYGLTDTEIETMLREAMAHASEDVAARNLNEQRVEAQRVLEALVQALKEDGEQLLSPQEIEQLQHGMDNLQQLLNRSENHREIKQAVDQLNNDSVEFAARRMDAGIKKAMAGHKVGDFE